ncbi:flagellar hook-associated protein 3 [Glaciihabitans sp. INWT7]|nr:flagellar hook-associated protein FlgL [Glaciihabitans sp. INWT7]QNE48212.1 flagellar hook-associated protein 3 [Glaciihabitans sp. INWT7]
MVNRVTSQTRMANSQMNLQSAAALLAKLQDTATSLKKITTPSDDPTGTADSMRVRAAQSQTAQFGRNADDGMGWLSTVDATLSASTDIMHQVRDLTVQGANDGSLSPTAKEAIATALEGLRTDLLGKANATYLGRTVFAGSSDAGVAFRPDLSYTGTGSSVIRRIDTNATVQVDADGAAAFGTGASSAFALIDSIVADLRSGVNVGPSLAAIDTRMTAMLNTQTAAGARQNQITAAKDAIVSRTGNLEAQRAGIEDADVGEIVIKLKQQEVTYQAALAVTARTLQPTLMDFLR